MKRQLSILLVIAFMLSLTSAIAIANEVPFGATVTDLIADGGSPETAMTVGEVQVWNDAEYLYVQYMVTAPWCLTKDTSPCCGIIGHGAPDEERQSETRTICYSGIA
jgi:hypothetical protein